MRGVAGEVVARLRDEVSVQRLVEGTGIALSQRRGRLSGACPWCPEGLLVVDVAANSWACPSCDGRGGPVEWVMRVEGVSERHAVELLREGLPVSTSAVGGGLGWPKRSTVPKLAGLFDVEMSDGELLEAVVAFYHRCLLEEPEALAWLDRRRISVEAVERFRLGLSNRTLCFRLPHANRVEGAQLRERLQELGVYRKSSGHEAFRGSVTFPITNTTGSVVQLYGRKIGGALRKGTPLHTWLTNDGRPWFNVDVLARTHEVVVCGSVIDALTLWSVGMRNTIAAAGPTSIGDTHLKALSEAGVGRVLLAFRRDPTGDREARRIADRLIGAGVECLRVEVTAGADINDYACAAPDAAAELERVVRAATWLGGTTTTTPLAPATAASPVSSPATVAPVVSSPATATAAPTETAAPVVDVVDELELEPGDVEGVDGVEPDMGGEPDPTGEESDGPEPDVATEPVDVVEAAVAAVPSDADGGSGDGWLVSPVPFSPPAGAEPQLDAQGSLWLSFGDRRWRVRGLARNTSFDVLRVQVMVTRTNASGEHGVGAGFHMDTLDLCAARARGVFCKDAAVEIAVDEQVLRKDLGQVLGAAEGFVEEAIRVAQQPVDTTVHLDPDERANAMRLLTDPDLVGRIVTDFGLAGMVGEETNCLIGYLAAVSRKLDRPLAVVIQSTSAAGKSALMDAVLEFVPPEERISYSAMTGQSLYYMGEGDLAHKVLAVAEEEGAERASYPLKLLQSEGELSIASTGKDNATGRLVSHDYKVRGPAAIFLTTTAIDIDEELLNRCVVLSVNEDRAQTRAIHDRQRRARTLAGLLSGNERAGVVKQHRDAQRLLEPVAVVNPFADRLGFVDTVTRTRRDHVKYLTLISAVALLHQHQRPRLTATTVDGTDVTYIEATLGDIEVANRLAHEVLGRSLDELPPQTRRVLGVVDALVGQRAGDEGVGRDRVRFTRRDVRGACGLSDMQCRKHLERLVDLEYVLVHKGSRGSSFVYELIFTGDIDSAQPRLTGLVDTATLTADAATMAADEGAEGAATTPTSIPSTANLDPPDANLDPPSTPPRPPLDPASTPGPEDTNGLVDGHEPALGGTTHADPARLGAAAVVLSPPHPAIAASGRVAVLNGSGV